MQTILPRRTGGCRSADDVEHLPTARRACSTLRMRARWTAPVSGWRPSHGYGRSIRPRSCGRA